MRSLENLSVEELKQLAQQAATTFNSTIKVGLVAFFLGGCVSKAQPIGNYKVSVVDTLIADGVIFPYVDDWDSRDTVEFRPIRAIVHWSNHTITVDSNNYLILGSTQTVENGLLLIICQTDENKKIILVYDEDGLSQIEIPSDKTIYSANTTDLWAERVNNN